MSKIQFKLKSGVLIRHTESKDAEALEELQNIVFPTLSDEERLKKEHYLNHLKLFPEGQFVAEQDGKVVGMTSTLILNFDFEHIDHTFLEAIDNGWFGTHVPDGDWLYGADIGTHPEYRKRGIARGLYAARQEVVKKLNLKGQVTVGMLSGYGRVKDEMSIEEYVEKLKSGQLTDPTLSAQQRVGFEFQTLVRNYLDDPVCDGSGLLISMPASMYIHLG